MDKAKLLIDKICDNITDLTEMILENTGIGSQPVLKITISEELGIRIGVVLGKPMTILTPAGLVGIECAGVETGTLQRALGDAVVEIETHNMEYGYVTPSKKISEWRKLASDGTKR